MWWFSENSKKLGYGDNRVIRIGRTHKVNGKPVLCKHGLHASKKIIDALQYARGNIIWKVKLDGIVIHDNDKSVATKRIYLDGGINAEEILRKFARMCALDVIYLWDAPPIVIEYLKTGDESKREAARAAARAAARDAARDAAWAAGSAARDAWAAARGAAWDAARDAAEKKQNKRLTGMVNRVIKRGEHG